MKSVMKLSVLTLAAALIGACAAATDDVEEGAGAIEESASPDPGADFGDTAFFAGGKSSSAFSVVVTDSAKGDSATAAFWLSRDGALTVDPSPDAPEAFDADGDPAPKTWNGSFIIDKAASTIDLAITNGGDDETASQSPYQGHWTFKPGDTIALSKSGSTLSIVLTPIN